MPNIKQNKNKQTNQKPSFSSPCFPTLPRVINHMMERHGPNSLYVAGGRWEFSRRCSLPLTQPMYKSLSDKLGKNGLCSWNHFGSCLKTNIQCYFSATLYHQMINIKYIFKGFFVCFFYWEFNILVDYKIFLFRNTLEKHGMYKSKYLLFWDILTEIKKQLAISNTSLKMNSKELRVYANMLFSKDNRMNSL